MIASWWRSTATAPSARSTGWHAVDLCYVSVARRILVRVTRAEWRRLLLYPALLSLGAGALVSCTGEKPLPPPQISAIRPLPPPSQERAPPPPTALGPAGSLPPKTSELIGMDQPAATRLFGAAAERSEQPPATVWRYKSATCELDLFFYLDLRSGRMRTLHYALKGDGADAARGQDCLRSLLTARS